VTVDEKFIFYLSVPSFNTAMDMATRELQEPKMNEPGVKLLSRYLSEIRRSCLSALEYNFSILKQILDNVALTANKISFLFLTN
jgi:hypothetical protein